MLLNGAGHGDSCPLWDGGQVPLKCLIIQFLVSLNGGLHASLQCSLIHLNTCRRMCECAFLNGQNHSVTMELSKVKLKNFMMSLYPVRWETSTVAV